jgi:hypothetical protein
MELSLTSACTLGYSTCKLSQDQGTQSSVVTESMVARDKLISGEADKLMHGLATWAGMGPEVRIKVPVQYMYLMSDENDWTYCSVP